MSRTVLRALCGILAWISLAAPAAAHTRSESHSLWEIGARQVDLVVTVPVAVVAPLSKGGQPPSDADLQVYIAERAYPIADGTRCKLVPPVETLSAVAGFRKFDLTFACGAAHKLQIHSTAFSDFTPSHTDFAQVQDARSGDLTEQIITRDQPTIDVVGEGGQLATAHFGDFILMGVMHIFTGIDHMSFLLGLVLISKRLRDLLFVVTGFTIGHSLTLALAVTGVLRPHAEYIDALVALTIALIGAENVVAVTKRPLLVAAAAGLTMAAWVALRAFDIGTLPILLLAGSALFVSSYLVMSGSLPDAGRLRVVMTVVFGLIHGFGFAANLLEMQLPTGRIAELLVGFNLGVEIGQMSLVLGVTLLVFGLRRLKFTLPRPIVAEVCSAFLVALGLYWFTTRSF